MASLHELKAKACPQPETPRTISSLNHQPNPNARFGWQIVRALKSPTPEIPCIGPQDVTPNRILAQMRGEQVFPSLSKSNIKPNTAAEIEYKKRKAKKEDKQKQARALRNKAYR